MPLSIIKMCIVLSVSMVQAIDIVLVLASYPLLVCLSNVSLLHPFNYCRLVRINKDMVDLNCVTQPFLASHGLTVSGLVLTFFISPQLIGILNLRHFVHHLLPLDFVVNSQIYL